jgi:hypothetical protein
MNLFNDSDNRNRLMVIDSDNRLMEYLKPYLEKGIIQSLDVKYG